jgi:NADH dehydrogenase FAD-containing subunit
MRDDTVHDGDGALGHGRVLLLVGGGHAHVAVLADLARRPVPAGARVVLLTPEPALRYSGMVPGWLAGQHQVGEGVVDLAGLAARAGAELVLDRVTALDPAARVVRTAGGAEIEFTIAAFDTGGEGHAAALLGEDPRLIDVRPISAFVERLAARLEALGASRGGLHKVVVAGGGAGGVELAFGLRNLGRSFAGAPRRPLVTLATGAAELLPGFAPAVRRQVARALARQGIALLAEDVRFAGGALVATAAGSLEPADIVIAALGSAAPGWVRTSGVASDADGFLLVDAHQRSLSHPHLFAAGDVAARADLSLPRSGVHAVMAGPILAANLRAALAGKAPPRRYHPRRHRLQLLNTGDGSAIAVYGPLAVEGRWVLALKHRIDKGWIAKYVAPPGA